MKKTLFAAGVCLSLLFHNTIKGEDLMDPYTARDKQFLLNLARATLYCYLTDRTLPEINTDDLPDKLKQKSGCFVTLEKKFSGLRGCIGYIMPVDPLCDGIINRAVAAAIHDPRFPAVRYNELKDIYIEISILTPPEKLEYESPEDLLDKLVPLRDGVVLKTPYGSSTYLPQVWEQLPDKKIFLNSLCAKHGAPRDAWRQPGVEILTYNAIVFHEDQVGRIVVGNKGAVVGPKGATIIGKTEYGYTQTEPQPAEPGTQLAPLTILSPDSDITRNK